MTSERDEDGSRHLLREQGEEVILMQARIPRDPEFWARIVELLIQILRFLADIF